MKTVFLFSGQGSQYPGMGAELAEKSSAAKQILECGSDIMGFDLMKKLTGSTPEELAQTRLSQPAIFTTSLLALAAARENDIDNVAVAGHSLGEYAAMYASGMLGMEDAFRAIKLRSAAMAEAAEATGGAMAAIIGSDNETIAKVCEEVNGFCAPANYNSPQQTVIAGEVAAIDEAVAKFGEMGKRAVKLAVSAAFHTKLMAPAGDALAQRFAGENFGTMETPVLFNCLGHEKAETDSIPQLLVKQVQSSVYMEDTLRRLGELGVDHILEVGPGSALSGFVKKTLPGVVCTAVETPEQLDAVLTAWKEAE